MTIEEQAITPEIETLDQGPDEGFLPLLPLKNVIILPKSVLPIVVGRPQSIKAVQYALKHNKTLFISTQKNVDVEHPTGEDVFEYGTRAIILDVVANDGHHTDTSHTPKNGYKILVEGLERGIIERHEPREGFLGVYYRALPTMPTEKTIEIEALWRHLKTLYAQYVNLSLARKEKVPADLMTNANSLEEIDTIADTLAIHINLNFDQRLEFLKTPDVKERLVMLTRILSKEVEIMETDRRIQSRVQSQVEKSQKEYYLTEQIKAIQKELGREDQQGEITLLRKKAKKLGLPADAMEKVEKELKRLEQMPPLSSEASVSRNYVDWILALPWSKASKDTISMKQAEKILEESHAGLEKPKERIIEFLAAKKFSKTFKRSPIICLVGPPGVGKTSLGKSIAESMGREFVRISLGGVRDEAEIRGHRRTYIGALPGKIIQAMRKAKTTNPVILLDEIDKMSRDIHGDPAAALLEVLDPEQNHTFTDHFLETEYDLSNVMFVATANSIDGIPYALFDRMELITLSGYTDYEKVQITRKFLVPKNLKEHSLTARQFKIPDDIIRKLISEYTRESGVRQLDRVVAKLMRKAIQLLLKEPDLKSVTISEELVQKWLGYPKFKKTSLGQSQDRIGIAIGLAWTEVGGDVLEIETSIIPGKGGLMLTGQLGEVMQESAQAALSYIRSRASQLGLKTSFNTTNDIHVHIPEGSTPKDGPSAGITMCTALISALTKNPTRPEVAMTGEITLRGRVLAIGGLKEKLLAAKQHGFKTIIVPLENRDDIEELTEEVKKDLDIKFVAHMDEVLKYALEQDPFAKGAQKKAQKKTKTGSKKKTSKAT
ncbi:MAG: endopeptidase La [Candidatus Babeliales bacterium]